MTCDGSAPYVCRSGPGYDTFAGKFPAIGGSPHKYPYSAQDDKYSALHGASAGGTAVTMFTPEQIPVKHAIAKEFGVFNKLYTAVPSASSPNHLFTQSATSCGMQTNTLYDKCGGKKVTFPQRTIYDSLRAHNVSFGLYMNSTCGLDGKPCHGESQHDPDSASAINTPDVAMEGVARHQDRFYSQTLFYERAANGTLPSLSWILPPQQACDHPCHDIAKGERLLKDVYEALRRAEVEAHAALRRLRRRRRLLRPRGAAVRGRPRRRVAVHRARPPPRVRPGLRLPAARAADDVDADLAVGGEGHRLPGAPGRAVADVAVRAHVGPRHDQEPLQPHVVSDEARCVGGNFEELLPDSSATTR